ncbi:hypothetical protein [Ralstonia pseudosolanacearum]|uniref:hypothetical protein n=1 Tax=Ralstonia pseudosolanacearum TaxID=1310165 RepID=UPI003CEF13CE
MENKIKNLEAQVAALHLFVISLMDALPEEAQRATALQFQEHRMAMLGDLQRLGTADDVTRFDSSVEAILDRSPSHPGL